MPDGSRPAPVAVITGASRGIGRILADGFADAGYRVAGCSRHGGTDRSGRPVPAVDVTDEVQVGRFVADVLAAYGRIDVLVNNAGLIEPERPLWEADPDQWWRVLEVNVRGPFLMSRAVAAHLMASGGGRVINLNSGAGTVARADLSAYCASKSALARITGALHLAGFQHGLRAFDLAPGVVSTDMTSGMASHVGRTEWTDPAAVAELALALASGRLDAWSGRLVRVGVDTEETLRSRAATELSDKARTIGLIRWGADDPLS